jgi:hypothetical protein
MQGKTYDYAYALIGEMNEDKIDPSGVCRTYVAQRRCDGAV